MLAFWWRSLQSHFYLCVWHAESEMYCRGERQLISGGWCLQEGHVPDPSLIFRVIEAVILNSLDGKQLVPEIKTNKQTKKLWPPTTEKVVMDWLLPCNESEKGIGSVAQQTPASAVFQLEWEETGDSSGWCLYNQWKSPYIQEVKTYFERQWYIWIFKLS